MSNSNKVFSKSRIAAGAALVALSGFVPQPLMNQAQAATATINVSGTFVGGITMTAQSNVVLHSFVASANTGSVSVSAGGVKGSNNAFFNGANPAAGLISFQAGAVKPVDITVTGLGPLTLGGAGATGTATLEKVFLTGPFSAAQTLTGGAGTTSDSNLGQALAAAATGTTADINVGALVSWTGNKPKGSFTQPIKVVVAY